MPLTIRTYLKNEFIKDLKKIDFQLPNDVIRSNPQSFRLDENTIFFGGGDWNNIQKDLSVIHPERRAYFILCLFTIVVIDLTMFTYYKDYYSDFRAKTMYPKFGWAGFGPHFESPKKLLSIPESKKLVDFSPIKTEIQEYVDLFVEESEVFFQQLTLSIQSVDFIYKILTDKDFQILEIDKGSFFELIYNQFKIKISQLS
jgi:hypothetical protein